jgi:hypothetical protein
MIENIQHFNYTKMTFEIHRRHLKWNQFKDILTVMFNSIKICQKFQFFPQNFTKKKLLWMEKTLKTASNIIIPSAYLLFAFQQERFCKLGWNVKNSIKKSSLILLMIFFRGKQCWHNVLQEMVVIKKSHFCSVLVDTNFSN